MGRVLSSSSCLHSSCLHFSSSSLTSRTVSYLVVSSSTSGFSLDGLYVCSDIVHCRAWNVVLQQTRLYTIQLHFIWVYSTGL